jgi:glycosyltransferase involved in cell wall biosynthesis
MRILFVLPEFHPYRGGIATCYDALVPALTAEGHDVDVLVGSAFTEDHEPREREGVHIEYLNTNRRREAFDAFTAYEAVPQLRRTLAAAWALFEQVGAEREKYDVVETTDFGLLFLPWVTQDTLPILVQLHASNGQISARDPKAGNLLQGHLVRLLELQGLRHVDRLQSYARPNVQEWSDRLGREVWYSPPPLLQRDLPIQDGLSVDTKAEGFVAGRIQYWKGPTVLCEAQAHLGGDDLRIDWAGRDTNYQSVGSSMSDYLTQTYPEVWGESICPIGEIPPEEVVKRQVDSQLVVVPSIWDVFNYTAAEAMQAGSVVVCSDGAGAADLIEHGENGFVVPAKDAKALAEALKTASRLSDKQRESIGRAAQETVQERLDPQTIAKRREDSYQKVRDENLSTPAPLWLTEAVKPTGKFEVSSRPLAFLDQLPLRDLGRYVLRRAWGKLIGSR